jgi:hypothetical protein
MTHAYELTGLTPATATTLLTRAQLLTAWAPSVPVLANEATPTAGVVQRRLLAWGRQTYLANDGVTELALGGVAGTACAKLRRGDDRGSAQCLERW